MNKAWEPNQPLKVLFDQIKDAVAYASVLKYDWTTK